MFSRAVSENLNCQIPRVHPISKKWAAVLPPIPDNFSVDNETLLKFLSNPLKSEIQDTHNKSQRRLMEPRSVQTWFDLTNEASSEKRFNETMNFLKEWNKDYTTCTSRFGRRVNRIKGNVDMQKQRACLSKIEELVDKMYGDIRNTRLYKMVKASLVESTKDWMKVKKEEFSINKIVVCTVVLQFRKYIKTFAPMRGIYLQLKLILHLYVLNRKIIKNGLLTSHSGYSCTIVSLGIFYFLIDSFNLAPLYQSRTEVFLVPSTNGPSLPT